MTSFMKMALAVMVMGLVVPAAARSQDRDTTHAMRIQVLELGLDAGGTTFSIPPHLSTPRTFFTPSFFLEGVSVGTHEGIPGRGFEVKQDLLAPLRAQWAREAQTQTFRTIMGSLQIGGALFMAARQLTGAGIMTAKPRPVRQRK